ncbi:peptidase M1 [Flavobacteriaceae bacterium AU392]|nr:peptidase M1 [Flavobacteriaceae bacterium]RKM85952.1 peptidase M1 [Flavobacteriaceae bacterium AU392]
MWYEIFKFEIKYRIKRPDTYAFFAFLFLFSIGGVDFIFEGMDFNIIKRNAPITIARSMAAITGISLVIASMVMGVPILRDFEYKIESLMFVNPIRKRDYLLGRFLGSFTVLLFVFSGMLWGFTLGEFMPWHKPGHLLPFNFLAYLQPFCYIVLPLVFFGAAVFFVTGFLSRKLIVVYTQAIFIFVLFMLTKSIENEFLQALLDPFSLTSLTDMVEGWSITQRNSQLIPFNDVLLYNKLFWVAIGSVVLIIGYYKFNFNVVRDKAHKKRKTLSLDTSNHLENFDTKIPYAIVHENIKTQCIQLIHHSLFYFKSILKETAFWAIVICGMIIIIINSISLGTVYGVDSYPKTHLIVGELKEMSGFFFAIILIFYSGELIWKERIVKLNLIYDATPISNFINLSGKFIGLILIYTVLMLSLILAGVLFQTVNGYYHYELDVYFYGFFLEMLPFLILYTFVAFLAQVLMNNKFTGIVATLILFVGTIILGFIGVEHDLLSFGGSILTFYSDMNGYGHFLFPYLLIKTYWISFSVLLFIVATAFVVRGTETSFKMRWRLSKYHLTKPLLRLGVLAFLLFFIIGTYIFYNTNILNTYWTSTKELEYRASYEKTLKKFEYIPQPKIVDVNLNVELYPSERNYTAEGYYIFQNTTETVINEIHVQKLIESNVTLEYVTFKDGAIKNNEYDEYGYFIYKLNKPLQPGNDIRMNFKQTFETKGFEESGSNSSVVKNGTFFNNKNFPTLGYNRRYELRNSDDRADYQLPKRLNKAAIDNSKELLNARSGSDSDGINFEMVIGTDKDQTAVVSGKLLKQWEENDRNYFHYKTNQSIIDFYSIVSAQYEIKKDIWQSKLDETNQPVNLEIYYHKGHEYNLNRMMESMKASFDYYSANFTPYQYEHLRIMEFPRYAEFAQSFPGTVPFSESIGFVLDIDDEKDVDMAFYVTAHELAHQWFGMQIEAANVQGQYFILETLSQYAAIMVLEHYYSKEKVQQFLELQKERYGEGKIREASEELPLALVENQDYIYYAKGAINMYTLQETIGEKNVNLAIKRFINDWDTNKGKLKLNTNRYATSKDLLNYFREVTPDDLQYLITELFESVNELKD